MPSKWPKKHNMIVCKLHSFVKNTKSAAAMCKITNFLRFFPPRCLTERIFDKKAYLHFKTLCFTVKAFVSSSTQTVYIHLCQKKNSASRIYGWTKGQMHRWADAPFYIYVWTHPKNIEWAKMTGRKMCRNDSLPVRLPISSYFLSHPLPFRRW